MPTYKKSDNEKFTVLIEKAMEELNEFPTVPGGMETLLDIPNRKPLPEVSGKGNGTSILHEMIKLTPHIYARYIEHIRRGSYPGPAAEAVGISSRTAERWGTIGKKDYAEEKDTYYSRFYQDVRRAVAQCRAAVEQAMVAINPQKWLSRGPGRIFGDHWAETPMNEEPAQSEQPFIEDQEVPEIEVQGVATEVIRLDPQTEEETLKILQEVLRKREDNKGDT